MTITQLKLKAIVLQAYMHSLIAADTEIPTERVKLVNDFHSTLEAAEYLYREELDQSFEESLDSLLAAIDSIGELEG